MELWDEYDKDGKLTGRTIVRGEPIDEGAYHLVVSVWVCDPMGRLLVTLRAPDKDTYPNVWENTAGSALAGETSRDAAARELYEETGILAEAGSLVLLKRLKSRQAFIDIYFLRLRDMRGELKLQAGETAAYRWVTLDELDDMILGHEFAAPVVRRIAVLRGRLERAIEGE